MAEQQLKRVLGKGFSIAACVGTIVGLGILRTPGEIAATISDPRLYMALWIGGGLFVLLTLLVVAELYATTPKSGGVYALVSHAYGPYPGFLIGWIDWLSAAAAGALKAVVFVEYLAILIPQISENITILALLSTSFFAILQLGGVRLGGTLHQTAVSIIGLAMLGITAALFMGIGNADSAVTIAAVTQVGAAKYGLVAAAIVFTYDGWTAATYFGGEIRGGGHQVAVGSIRGMLIVIAIYILLNLALVLSVPLSSLQGEDLALAAALDILYGSGTIVVLIAIFILLTHQNLQYMLASRILYALSVDGLGSPQATAVSEKGTPSGAVLITWVLSVVLILAGGFEFLLNMTVLMFMLMYISLLVGIFRLRRQEPDAERPYVAWAFPASGIICIIGWVAITLFIGYSNPLSTLYALGLIVVSIPAYLWLKSWRHLGTS